MEQIGNKSKKYSEISWEHFWVSWKKTSRWFKVNQKTEWYKCITLPIHFFHIKHFWLNFVRAALAGRLEGSLTSQKTGILNASHLSKQQQYQ